MNSQDFQRWLDQYAKNQAIEPHKTLLMGILNVTPDSFSDGGSFQELHASLAHARKMIAAGADIIDIGGESSRPGAQKISITEELARVIPVIKALRQESDICISIDTTKYHVMQAALAAGANIINDISALAEEEALQLAARAAVPVCLMHMRGTPSTMQGKTDYSKDIVMEINDFFIAQIKRCLEAGIKRENLILDPGFGFAKTLTHNMRLVRDITEFKCHGLPLLLGVSRKSTLGVILDKEVNERLIGGVAVAVFASLRGIAIIRTHDVEETRQALQMIAAIVQGEE